MPGDQKIKTLYYQLETRMRGLENDFRKAEQRGDKSAKRIQKSFQKASGNIKQYIAGFFAITAIATFVKKGADAFLSLDQGMRRFNTIAKLSQKELDGLKKEVVALSNELGTPTSELTGAMYQAVSAGVEVAEVMNFIRIATKGAIGGMVDVETVVDGLTTVLNSFKAEGLSTAEALDIMFKTVELGKTTAGELSSTLNLAASDAAIAGIKFYELSAAIATVTVQGTPTSMAMTQIRQAIIALNKNLGDGWRKTMTMQEGVELLIQKAKGSQNELLRMVGSVEALGAILKLSGESAETFSSNLIKIADASGTAQTALEEMEKSATRRLERLKTKVENLAGSLVEDFLIALGLVIRDFETFGDLVNDFIGMWERFLGIDTEKTTKGTKEIAENLDWINGNLRGIGDGFVKIVPEITKIVNDTEKIKTLTDEELKTLKSKTAELEKQHQLYLKQVAAWYTANQPGLDPSGITPRDFGEFGTKEFDEEYFRILEAKKNASIQITEETNQQAEIINSMVGMSAQIYANFNLAGHTFVADMMKVFNMITGISNVILSIASAFTSISGFGLGGLINLIGGKRGGEFIGTPQGVMKMAGGGSFTVPQGFSPDKYPLLLDSGEKVTVTPQGKMSDGDKRTSEIVTAINAMNTNMVSSGGEPIIINIQVGDEIITESVYREDNRNTLNKLAKTDF